LLRIQCRKIHSPPSFRRFHFATQHMIQPFKQCFIWEMQVEPAFAWNDLLWIRVVNELF
jgi:hypothetical protein